MEAVRGWVWIFSGIAHFWRGGGFNLKNLPWERYGYFVEQHNKPRKEVKIEIILVFCEHHSLHYQ